MLTRTKISLSIAFLLVFLTQAQEKKNGFIIDIQLVYNSIGDGFDGINGLVSADDVFAVPNFDDGIGFGLKAGYRYEGMYLELAYQRVAHNFIWVDIEGEGIYSSWSLNIRRLFLQDSKWQPFVQFGWVPAMPIRVKEGALLVSQNINSDAIFLGNIGNFNVGGGLEFAIKGNLSARLSAIYKRARYSSVESSEENVAIALENDINADDINLTFGIILVL